MATELANPNKLTRRALLLGSAAMAAVGAVGPVRARSAQSRLFQHSRLQAVPFRNVAIDDAFWAPRIASVRKTTLPLLLDLAEKEGKIENFRIVAGRSTAQMRLYNAPDSDVYKLIEAAAYALAQAPDADLGARIDALIDDIVAAQAPDGYLVTQYMIAPDHPGAPRPDEPKIRIFGFGPEHRWASTSDNWPFAYSQLYCAGHLMEAAVAYAQATGKRKLLDAAIRFADHIDTVFTEAKVHGYADHPQIEIGLMLLYEETGEERYFRLADRLVRHVDFTRPVDLGSDKVDCGGRYCGFTHQTEAFGHAVRTAYLYSGATDVARVKGAKDLSKTIHAVWKDVTAHKMYVHGGTGNGTTAEQHGLANDLPILRTYSECCAAIAQGQWNHRLNLMTGAAAFADLVEVEAYNNALSGISLEGDKFFYSNKLNIGTDRRRNQHSGVRKTYLFCCPSKLPGFVAGIGRWAYATSHDALFVNLFIGGTVVAKVAGDNVRLRQRTAYPFSGNLAFEVEQASGRSFSIAVRIPGWARGEAHIPNGPYTLARAKTGRLDVQLNGVPVGASVDDHGYLRVKRAWKAGDRLNVRLPMEPARVRTDDRIAANRGRVALMHGPLIYALEGVDNDFDLNSFVLPSDAEILAVFEPELLGGVMTLSGTGQLAGQSAPFKAVPYYAWQNRGVGSLATMLIEEPAETTPLQPDDHGPVNTQG